MKKSLLTIIATIAVAITTLAQQNVTIPDTNFKAKLLANTSINTDADKSEISIAEAEAFKGAISVFSSNIASLVGIEAFVNLTYLDCSFNSLTSLDVTKNTALQSLYCSSNQLTNLDVSKNTALQESLDCSSNQLTSLVIQNNQLITLNCSFNQLTSLDLTKTTFLPYLYCYNNKLKSLDVTKIRVTYLYCYNNQLTSLDVSENIDLREFYCYNNQLTSFDVSKIILLTELKCFNNQLTSLDVTKNTALTKLNCSSNQLSSLDVTINTALTKFDSKSNLKLLCIQALNSQIKTDWTIDPTTQYSQNCSAALNINDDEIVTQPKIISIIYNLQGQEVSASYPGLVIIRYTDGTSEKVIQ